MSDPPAIVPGKLIEIFREGTRNRRSVGVTLHENGDVGIDLQDMGPTVQEIFGDEDYERWTIVPATEVPRLAVALLIDKYAGKAEAVDAFGEFCERNGIRAKRGDF